MKKKVVFLVVAIFYIVVLAAYSLGKAAMNNTDLEFRCWVESLIRLWAWFMPVVSIGIYLFLKSRELARLNKKAVSRVISVGLILYCIVMCLLSFFYILYGALTLTTDEKMVDGNLVVCVQSGMESSHYYAEPVGILFRREIFFDDDRYAESLSKIYSAEFEVIEDEKGNTVFVSAVYPNIEVKMMNHGYTDTSYLQNTLRYAVTSKALEAHKDIFEKHQVALMPDVFGETEDNPEGYCMLNAVLVTDDNVEAAAKAITEFIQVTLDSDMRNDEKSLWTKLDGSIFLVVRHHEDDEESGSRNITFSLIPEYTWTYDESVKSEDVLKELKKELQRLD